MGCSQSRIDDEETVIRCEDRKRFTKAALSSRNAFAAAHSGFTVALRNMGAALSDYGEGEVNDHRGSGVEGVSEGSSSRSRPPPDPLPPPPPPPTLFATLQRAATMPEISIPKPDAKLVEAIVEEEDEEVRVTPTVTATTKEAPPLRAPPILPQVQPKDSVPLPTQPEQKVYEYFFAQAHEFAGSSSSEPEKGVANVDHGDKLKSVDDVGNKSGDTKTESRISEKNVGYNKTAEKVVPEVPEKVVEELEPELKTMKKTKQISRQPPITTVVDEGSKRGSKVAPNVTLFHIMTKLDELFLKASQNAYEVSKILEANRLHYHSNFADNQGHIDHSAKLMRVITWNKSIRGLQDADGGNDYIDPNETLATVLDKLLAWEKKLCDEVKAGELLKLEYERKIASLKDRERRGTNIEALERTKAAVSHLHTRYIVDIQTMDSTVSEISSLRDDHLYPKLVSLVDGMAKMWGNINLHHRGHMKIVEDIQYLNISQAPKETSEDHHKRTIQLWGAVEDWNSTFRKVVTHKKEYISALNSWLKLSLIPVENNLKERVSSPPRVPRPPIQPLLLAWHEHLEKLPDSIAGTSLSSFAAVIELIMIQQQDELKLKKKWEETSNELTRKTRQFEDWYNKLMQKRTPPDEMSGDSSQKDLVAVAEKKIVIENLKNKLQVEVEAHQRHCMQVREKALGSLKTRLPELFQDMANFSFACSEMYKKLGSIAHAQKQPENPQ
ncbi:hypothetical protein GIB67_006615 [Kingdonia uniflora]|uniref:Uncharacterized protein n=1 Tax=Kingdonia uniflora TaxID=39325 RepID=A0A7J7LEA4_9MAGN|nr:hypothetical protein GIB67_006615 [Kingdonia uniflora]